MRERLFVIRLLCITDDKIILLRIDNRNDYACFGFRRRKVEVEFVEVSRHLIYEICSVQEKHKIQVDDCDFTDFRREASEIDAFNYRKLLRRSHFSICASNDKFQ